MNIFMHIKEDVIPESRAADSSGIYFIAGAK
jgi:hypothetical protein